VFHVIPWCVLHTVVVCVRDYTLYSESCEFDKVDCNGGYLLVLLALSQVSATQHRRSLQASVLVISQSFLFERVGYSRQTIDFYPNCQNIHLKSI
jgi:hypothetical protein